MLNSFFARVTQDSITLPGVLLCTGVSLLLGVLIALIYMRQARYESFAVTLALLPAMVEIVILLVNGNLGTGVAVAGAFGLVRGSAPCPAAPGRSAASFSPWPSALPPAWAIWICHPIFFF